MSPARARWDRRRSALGVALALLACAGVLLQGASLPHLHLAPDEPGFFDHEHDGILLLALGTSGALPAEAPDVAPAPALRHDPRVPGDRLAAAPDRLADSRAPPLA
jgi:hypothetical protein